MHGAYRICVIDRWGLNIINGAYFLYAPLKGKISMAHFLYAPRIRHDILSTTLLVDLTWVLVPHSAKHAPLVVKLSVEHIFKCATSKY
jgi:hypothetical protein